MRRYVFFDKFDKTQRGILTLEDNGDFSAEPADMLPYFAGMVRWLGPDDKPTSIFDFVKSGLYNMDVVRLADDGEMYYIGEGD